MSSSRMLTAAEATALLGVKPATLYAYVSRGLIRSEAGPPGTRERRYHAGDIQGLLERQGLRRDPQQAVRQAAEGALDWGLPVLESVLTQISDGRLFYRGQDAVRLAERSAVEEVAALLWTGEPAGWARLSLRARLTRMPSAEAQTLLEALGVALVHAGAHDLMAQDVRPEALPAQAARVLSLLYAAAERQARVLPAPDLPLHARLARAWRLGAPEDDLLRRALVLLADHELNVSAFAARVAASGGASLHHTTLAALAALQGRSHGLAGVAAHDLLQKAMEGGAAQALRQALQERGHPPGFGHPLYGEGDPRARALLGALQLARPGAPVLRAVQDLTQQMRGETGEAPNVDLALAALMHLLRRPAEDAAALFALGRAPGWLAHASEARLSGHMIRPRAKYVGPVVD
ncbi:citrate synthase family protein [Deinococcus hopiensis]|nr:citrate synthase family protein [Deinococcus hopiensis]